VCITPLLPVSRPTDGEVAEVVALTVLNIFTNYFNTAFQVDIDFPVAKALATAAR
jgi:hypothetical protein